MTILISIPSIVEVPAKNRSITPASLAILEQISAVAEDRLAKAKTVMQLFQNQLDYVNDRIADFAAQGVTS